jgi:ribosomal protein L13, archaeal/eukaryotic
VLGRLASQVAKRLLNGETIIIVNVEKAVIKGNWLSIVREWEHRYEIKSVINPFRHSPKRYVRPDKYFRSVVKRMLPYRKAKGKSALSRLKVYIGVPAELVNQRFESVDVARVNATKGFYTLETIAKRFGWKGV